MAGFYEARFILLCLGVYLVSINACNVFCFAVANEKDMDFSRRGHG